jgi:hypothetical protein
MILKPPASLVQFLDAYLPWKKRNKLAPPHILAALTGLLSAICLSRAKRTQTELGRFVFTERRDPATISRMLRNHRFRTRDLYCLAYREAIQWALPPEDAPTVSWHLSLDGVSNTRGAFTKIRGANDYEKEKDGTGEKRKKGTETKSHLFLVGTVTTHEGHRIPVPRRTCDPRGFHRHPGRPRKKRPTQVDLAAVSVQELAEMLPENVRLVVTADEYFEGQKIVDLARKLGNVVFIAPVDSRRCFSDPARPRESNGQLIQAWGKKLPWGSFERMDLVRGEEETVPYRRYSDRKPGPKDRRTYWVHHERRTVSMLGEVGVVASWKSPVFRPRKNFKRRSFKVLICSDPDFPPRLVVEFFEMRWTNIEIVIREMKSCLGFKDYVGTDLEAMERHIDLVLLGLLYLEVNRMQHLEDVPLTQKARRVTTHARVQGMQDLVRGEVTRELWALVERAVSSVRARQLLKRFFESLAGEVGLEPCVPYG